jgi:hypothetical protein
MRLPPVLRCRKPTVVRPVPTFEEITGPLAYVAFCAFVICAILIVIVTRHP